ncbi:MAG TPA: hypothetical protein VFQ53_01625 [Kofleriaceae bacterium]|nr:hypothetical protein [Kofleriaceae bacterium]
MTKPALLARLALLGILAPALADADDKPTGAPHALVVHVPPTESRADTPIELEAMLDAPFAETLAVRWRAVGEAQWHDAMFERSSAGGWYTSIPGTRSGGVEYYIEGRDAAGAPVAHFASAAAPHVVRVEPSLTDRLESLDLDRLGEHRNEVSLDVYGHNFGNRYDIPDRFVRAELAFTHRLLRVVHHVAFGFGSISGKTPLDSIDGGDYTVGALRYGFGEIRLRAHPSVFIDARAMLGASHDGFDQGVRGAVTFGKPWRSCLTFGAETIGDLGPSGWVRLQWDTAPPLLMGASIVRTDLPGAVIDSAGLYLGYDVQYTIAKRFTMRGQVSYGSRDGGSHLGGGVGTAVAF